MVHNRSVERPTGIISHMKNLSMELSKRGHDVTVATRGRPMRFQEDGVEHCQNARIPIIANGFDVIHAHDVRTSFLLARTVRRKTSGCRIITNHGVHANPSIYSIYSYWESESIAENLVLKAQLYAIRLAGRIAFRVCDRAIAVSRFVKNELEEIYGVPASKIATVSNGVNIKDFNAPTSNNVNKMRDFGNKIIVIVKPYDPVKGLYFMIKALELVHKYSPDFRLVAVGPKPTGKYGEYIKHLIDRSGFGEKIKFTGWIYGNDLASLYHQSAFVAMPSLYESSGITALEAAACSKPVLGFNVGGLAETVQDGKTGILVKPNDTNALAKWTGTLLEDERLCRVLGNNGRERAINFDWERIARKVEKIYESVP